MQGIATRVLTVFGLVALLPAAAAEQPDDIDGTTHEVAIRAIIDEGIASGFEDGTFRPGIEVSRGQVASFVQAALDLPDYEVTDLTDVAGTTHAAAIGAVVEAGVAGGFPDGTFRPSEAVTRGQMATLLTNAFDLVDDAETRFLDVAGTTHAEGIGAVAAEGVAGGFGDGEFRPGANVTRGQMATFLARSLDLVDRIDPPQLPDPIADAAAAWGWNTWGTLGNGEHEVTAQLTPVTVAPTWSGQGLETIDGGVDHSCVVVEGRVWCWGYNQWGQVGDGTTTTRLTPTPVDTSGDLGGRTVTDLAVGGGLATGGAAHTCVVADGEVFCWGENASGRLGDGTDEDRRTPVAVDTFGVLDGRTVTQVAAGMEHTCALADGEVFCWGTNVDGQLGWGFPDVGLPAEDQQSSNVPVALDDRGDLPESAVVAIAANHWTTCAVADGGVYCWGSVTDVDGTGRISPSPIDIDHGRLLVDRTVTDITAGDDHFCVIADGEVFCWGVNQFGQLGDGSLEGRDRPVAVDTSGDLAGGSVTDVAAGAMHTCAVADGEVYCWGSNGNGQLGDGRGGIDADPSPVPVQVSRTGSLDGATAVQVGAGGSYSFVTLAGRQGG